MLDVYTVCFFGHRQIDRFQEVEQHLEDVVREFLAQKEYVEFLVGRNGEFDLLASSVVVRMKRTVRDDNSALVLVLPYMTAEYENNRASFDNYYDEVTVSDAATAGKHFKATIQARNREIIDRSDLVICCIQHRSGGAFQTIQYAEKQRKLIINLVEI